MAKEPQTNTRLASYVVGLILSVLLTLTAFQIVAEGTYTGWTLTLTLIGFALVQLMVQLMFFLHLDKESKPRWNLMAFLFMGLVLLIVVLGSLWIMHNLSYHSMTPVETQQHLMEEEGIYR